MTPKATTKEDTMTTADITNTADFSFPTQDTCGTCRWKHCEFFNDPEGPGNGACPNWEKATYANSDQWPEILEIARIWKNTGDHA